MVVSRRVSRPFTSCPLTAALPCSLSAEVKVDYSTSWHMAVSWIYDWWHHIAKRKGSVSQLAFLMFVGVKKLCWPSCSKQMTEDSFIYHFTLLYCSSALLWGGAQIIRTRDISVSVQCHYLSSEIDLRTNTMVPWRCFLRPAVEVVVFTGSRVRAAGCWNPPGLRSVSTKLRGKTRLLPRTHDWWVPLT